MLQIFGTPSEELFCEINISKKMSKAIEVGEQEGTENFPLKILLYLICGNYMSDEEFLRAGRWTSKGLWL